MNQETANERTSLGWQRTGLSALAVTAIVARYRLETHGWWGIVPLALVLPVVIWLFVLASLRYGPVDPSEERTRDARAPLALAVVIAALALGELVLLLEP